MPRQLSLLLFTRTKYSIQQQKKANFVINQHKSNKIVPIENLSIPPLVLVLAGGVFLFPKRGGGGGGGGEPPAAAAAAGVVLVDVGAREVEEERELHGAEPRQQPVEVIEVRTVEVVGEPAVPAAGAGDAVDDRDEQAADESPDAHDAEVEREAQAAQAVGHLVVEELLQAHHRQHVRHPHHGVLRHDPRPGHGHRRRRVVHQAVLPRRRQPPRLHQRRHHHTRQRRGHAGAHALQHGEPRRVARGPPQRRHQRAVVDRHGQQDAGGAQRLEQRRWQLKAGDAPVQGAALLVEERHDLRVHHAVRKAGRPDGKQAQNAPGVGLGVLLLLLRVRRHRHRHRHPHAACEAAERGLGFRRRGVEAVRRGAQQEDEEGAEHDGAGDAEAEPPPDVLLDVAHHGDGHGDAYGHAEEPPVEEGPPRRALPLVLRVELVRRERQPARLVRALRDGDQVQRHVEEGHLRPPGPGMMA